MVLLQFAWYVAGYRSILSAPIFRLLVYIDNSKYFVMGET